MVVWSGVGWPAQSGGSTHTPLYIYVCGRFEKKSGFGWYTIYCSVIKNGHNFYDFYEKNRKKMGGARAYQYSEVVRLRYAAGTLAD